MLFSKWIHFCCYMIVESFIFNQPKCTPGLFSCRISNTCISSIHVCDGKNDCQYNEDEHNCGIVPNGCEGGIAQNGTSGVISSADVTRDQTTNVRCRWNIYAPPGRSIEVKFDPSFHIAGDAMGLCLHGGVTIFNAVSDYQIGTFCGDTAPQDIDVGSNHVVVQFLTSHMTDAFTIHWKAASTGDAHTTVFSAIELPLYGTQPSGLVNSSSCMNTSIIMTGQTGYISIYDPKSRYVSNIDCRWEIVGPEQSFIVAHFDEFELEYSEKCLLDSLSLYDGADDDATLISRLCGKSRPGEILSSANKMFLHFTSDGSIEGRGFSVRYSVVSRVTTTPSYVSTVPPPGCSGKSLNFTQKSGTLTSPDFDGINPYVSNLNCTQLILAPAHKAITLHFTEFELESSANCTYDALRIYDGSTTSSPLIGNVCGLLKPLDIVSSGNTVLLYFTSDQGVGGIGYNISYYSHTPIPTCAPTEFTCGSGECVSWSSVCDALSDCSDASDEMVCDITQGCGSPVIPPDLDTHRIVGGKEAVPGSWPWQVSVRKTDVHQCGGTLIHPYWVATAAHCFETTDEPSMWSISAGKHKLLGDDDNEQVRQSSAIIVHRKYDSYSSVNDIALIRLEVPVNITDHVDVVCLPTKPVYPSMLCFITGWGATENTCCFGSLKQAPVPIVDSQICNQHDFYNGQVIDGMFCAGYIGGGTDACNGDSGGPLVCPVDGRWQLEGITSWGVGCADPKKLGVYTTVYNYTRWIHQTIALNLITN